jgi:hypothetical protein
MLRSPRTLRRLFVRFLNNDRWYRRFTESDESRKSSVAADEVELFPVPIGLLPAHDCNGLLEPDLADVGNDHLPLSPAARSGISNVNLIDWNPFDVLFRHTALSTRARCAISIKKFRLLKR